MATASIRINQAANDTPTGVAGRSRDDITAGDVVQLLNADDTGMGDVLAFDAERLRILVERHLLHTGSARARELLDEMAGICEVLDSGDAARPYANALAAQLQPHHLGPLRRGAPIFIGPYTAAGFEQPRSNFRHGHAGGPRRRTGL